MVKLINKRLSNFTKGCSMKIGKAWILISFLALAACVTDTKISEEVQAAKLAADTARDEAMEAKAPRAAEAEFVAAQVLYDEAEKSLNSGSEAEAIANFNDAASEFLKAAGIAREAKTEAEKAISEADRAIARSEQIVEDAIRSVTEGQ